MKLALAFDDVLILPEFSTIESREQVDISTHIGEHKLKLPIISANMATVTGEIMAKAIAKQGGLGILDRTTLQPSTVKTIVSSAAKEGVLMGASVGVDSAAFDTAISYASAGCPIVCIDVAHGHHVRVLELVSKLLAECSDLTVIAGNIATRTAYLSFREGVPEKYHSRLVLKVGVGSGSLCSTRIVTGCGLPTFESLRRIDEEDDELQLIADGGIKNSGDIVKSLALRASAVMVGSLLAGTQEAPGAVIKDGSTGSLYKVYQGSASLGIKKRHTKKESYIEGAEMLVPYKGPVTPVLQRLADGIRSGLSYVGARNLNELQVKASFVQVTNAGSIESRPHNLL